MSNFAKDKAKIDALLLEFDFIDIKERYPRIYETIMEFLLEKKKGNEKLKEKADKWDALINSDRIRILGTGGLGSNNQHFGMEIWDKLRPEFTEDSRRGQSVLNTYVETIINNNNFHCIECKMVVKGDYVKSIYGKNPCVDEIMCYACDLTEAGCDF